jgi:hypothetical protein
MLQQGLYELTIKYAPVLAALYSILPSFLSFCNRRSIILFGDSFLIEELRLATEMIMD